GIVKLPVKSSQPSHQDSKSINEFLADLNAEFHDKAPLANQKRFYKRSGRVGSTKKPMDKSNETCFAYGKLGHFQEDCPSNKTSTLLYPSSNKSYNMHMFHTNSTPQYNQSVNNHKKDYKGKYKGLKAEIDILTKNIDAISKGKNKKGLVAKSFDSDKESVSSKDERVTKVHRLLSMTDGEERKHVLDYTHVDLHYVEDQRKNLLSKFNSLNQELSSYESPSETALEITSDSESECDNQDPLPPFPKLPWVEPIGTSNDEIPLTDLTLTLIVPKKTKQVTNKVSSVNVAKKKTQIMSPFVLDPCLEKKADSSTEQFLLTLMEEVKGSSKSAKDKQKTWYGTCKHCRYRNHLPEDFYIKPECSTCGSSNHLTKEYPEQAVVKKTLAKLKAQSSQGSSLRKAPMISKPYIDYKYYGFNNHHSDKYEYYPGCDICGSIAHETADYVKKPSSNNRKPKIANRRSTEPTKKWVHKRK
ncbi:retrovirus-related pol polyprotein from transposon TNT 1-94, partial [Tanacetum coccineum]